MHVELVCNRALDKMTVKEGQAYYVCPNTISLLLSFFFYFSDDLSRLLAGSEGSRLSVYHSHNF